MSTTMNIETIDQTRPDIPMTRLVKVECRKLIDTRAGKWLLIAIVGLGAAIMIIQLIVATVKDLSLNADDLIGAMTPVAILLPILGILSVTSEWSQRTGLVTFTLEPKRSRVVVAKFAAGTIAALVSVVFAMAFVSLGTLLAPILTGQGGDFNFSLHSVFGFAVTQVIALITGAVFGMLFKNTPAAIVVYFIYSFALPGFFFWLSTVSGWFKDLQPWIDFSNAQGPLFEGHLGGQEVARFLVSGFIWLVVPLWVGVWSLLRSEVK